MKIDATISRNFETAKVAAILTVACGHFLPPSSFWVVVSVALCLFAFASGYFTALIYGHNPDSLSFVRNKLTRLGPDLIAINLLLLVMFLLQGKTNILSWQSLLGVLGLSGWLNWLYLPNLSPFGAGLWYFSLLLVFYVCYPLLTRLLRGGVMGKVATFTLLLATLFLSDRIQYGHMLWFTAFCFCFGVAFANQQWQAGWKNTLLLASVQLLAFVMARFLFGAPINTLIVIAFAALITIQLLLTVPLPNWLHAPFKPFSACVLEIYFLHTYLFVHPSGIIVVDLLASLTLVLVVSMATKQLANLIQRRLFP